MLWYVGFDMKEEPNTYKRRIICYCKHYVPMLFTISLYQVIINMMFVASIVDKELETWIKYQLYRNLHANAHTCNKCSAGGTNFLVAKDPLISPFAITSRISWQAFSYTDIWPPSHHLLFAGGVGFYCVARLQDWIRWLDILSCSAEGTEPVSQKNNQPIIDILGKLVRNFILII